MCAILQNRSDRKLDNGDNSVQHARHNTNTISVAQRCHKRLPYPIPPPLPLHCPPRPPFSPHAVCLSIATATTLPPSHIRHAEGTPPLAAKIGTFRFIIAAIRTRNSQTRRSDSEDNIENRARGRKSRLIDNRIHTEHTCIYPHWEVLRFS